MELYPDKQKRKLTLPFTEVALIQGMTSYSAHADDLAQLSMHELDREKIDSISSLQDMHRHRRND